MGAVTGSREPRVAGPAGGQASLPAPPTEPPSEPGTETGPRVGGRPVSLAAVGRLGGNAGRGSKGSMASGRWPFGAVGSGCITDASERARSAPSTTSKNGWTSVTSASRNHGPPSLATRSSRVTRRSTIHRCSSDKSRNLWVWPVVVSRSHLAAEGGPIDVGPAVVASCDASRSGLRDGSTGGLWASCKDGFGARPWFRAWEGTPPVRVPFVS